jgi:hypothetical protein
MAHSVLPANSAIRACAEVSTPHGTMAIAVTAATLTAVGTAVVTAAAHHVGLP